MVGLSVVDDLGDELPADQNVDWLYVQVHNSVAVEVPESVHQVEEQTDFGPKRNSLISGHNKEIEFFSLDVLHEEGIRGIEGGLHTIVLGDEIRAAPFEFGHHVLLVF